MNLHPKPKCLELYPGNFQLSGHSLLHVACEGHSFDFLAAQCGLTAVAESGQRCRAWIGEPDQALAVREEGAEAYALRVSPTGLTAAADTPEGLSLAVRTMVKLAAEDSIPCMRMDDAPALRMRGLHLCVFPANDGTQKEDTSPDALRAMLREAALHGYNHVFIEFWGTYPYQRRPYACWPDTQYTPEVVQSILSECMNGWHMRAIPVQNLTSHAGWSRIGSRKHVVLDQRPDLSPMWIPGGWCFATENADTKAYLRDVMDELCEAYHTPPIFHVSCDKCFGFGSSEADRVHDADTLFVRHLHFLHDELSRRGARMMMWADMLYGALDSRFWKASPSVVDVLPRDIIMNVWTHNDPGSCWPDIDFFQGKGFETVYSPFLDEESVRNMAAMCMRKHSLGLLQTTWYCPQRAVPAVRMSGDMQWEGV